VDRRRIARSLRHRLCLDAAIAPQHRAIAVLVAYDLLRLITCRMGVGNPRGRAPRQDRACQTGFQGSEIEPVQPDGSAARYITARSPLHTATCLTGPVSRDSCVQSPHEHWAKEKPLNLSGLSKILQLTTRQLGRCAECEGQPTPVDH
jgi:hypothetical protein